MAVQESGQRRGVGFLGWMRRLLVLVLLAAAATGGFWYWQRQREIEVLNQIISRLTAEERVADVWVEEYQPKDGGGAAKIRLKVLEFDVKGQPLKPIFCTFSLNDVIHFEALVIRLKDELVMEGEGKSAYLFRRAYALDDRGNTYESCDINGPGEIPGGYRLGSNDRGVNEIEAAYWKSFWKYVLDEKQRDAEGVKSAQIEAPATRFVPDKIYRIFLDRDGGLRIEAGAVPEILKGEHVKIQTPTKPSEVVP